MVATLTFRQERFVFEYLKDQNASNLALAGSTVRTVKAGRARFAEKPQVLSGWQAVAQVDGEGRIQSLRKMTVVC